MQNQQEIQLKLSTIFKLKIIDTSQAFGSFYDPNGEKYCAVSVHVRIIIIKENPERKEFGS